MNKSDLDQTDRGKTRQRPAFQNRPIRQHFKASDAKVFPKGEQNNNDTFKKAACMFPSENAIPQFLFLNQWISTGFAGSAFLNAILVLVHLLNLAIFAVRLQGTCR